MRLENSFEVPASPAQTWELLNDVPRVVPCMPGAELTEVVDADTWKATMHVKLGPIALQFATDVRRSSVDEVARRTTLSTKARELKGRGGASATIESSLEPADGGTRITIVTDLQMQGAVAQYGRGVVNDVANQLVSRFASCLASELEAAHGGAAEQVTGEAAPAPGPPAPGAPAAFAVAPVSAPRARPQVKPVGGLGLVVRAILRRLLALVRRR